MNDRKESYINESEEDCGFVEGARVKIGFFNFDTDLRTFYCPHAVYEGENVLCSERDRKECPVFQVLFCD